MTPDPLDRAVAAFRDLPAPARPPDADLLAKLAAEPARPRPRRRTVSRAAILTLAASVLAAGVLLTGGSAVALTDVPKAAEKHKLVRYTLAYQEVPSAPKKLPPANGDATCFADLHAPRMRAVERVLTLNGHVEMTTTTVVDWTADRTLHARAEMLVPDKPVEAYFRKTYEENAGRFPVRQANLTRATPFDCEPSEDQRKPFLDRLRELAAHPKATASKDPQYGPTVVRFRIADGNKTTDLWVDVATALPVRWWYELKQPDTGDAYRWTYTDFAWDPKLPDGVKSLDELFSVRPPAGYTLDDRTGKK